MGISEKCNTNGNPSWRQEDETQKEAEREKKKKMQREEKLQKTQKVIQKEENATGGKKEKKWYG